MSRRNSKVSKKSEVEDPALQRVDVAPENSISDLPELRAWVSGAEIDRIYAAAFRLETLIFELRAWAADGFRQDGPERLLDAALGSRTEAFTGSVRDLGPKLADAHRQFAVLRGPTFDRLLHQLAAMNHGKVLTVEGRVFDSALQATAARAKLIVTGFGVEDFVRAILDYQPSVADPAHAFDDDVDFMATPVAGTELAPWVAIYAAQFSRFTPPSDQNPDLNLCLSSLRKEEAAARADALKSQPAGTDRVAHLRRLRANLQVLEDAVVAASVVANTASGVSGREHEEYVDRQFPVALEGLESALAACDAVDSLLPLIDSAQTEAIRIAGQHYASATSAVMKRARGALSVAAASDREFALWNWSQLCFGRNMYEHFEYVRIQVDREFARLEVETAERLSINEAVDKLRHLAKKWAAAKSGRLIRGANGIRNYLARLGLSVGVRGLTELIDCRACPILRRGPRKALETDIGELDAWYRDMSDAVELCRLSAPDLTEEARHLDQTTTSRSDRSGKKVTLAKPGFEVKGRRKDRKRRGR